MRKTKTQKIIYTAAIIILAIILGIILLSNFGLINFEEEINRVVNSDFYWESEPFGELEAVWYLKSNKTDVGGDHYIVSKLCDKSESKEYEHGINIEVKKLKKLNYRNTPQLFSTYIYNGMQYVALFVPDDCAYVEINGERFDTQSGKINTPEGEVEFKYFTATYKSPHDSRKPGVDKYVLYSEKGKAYDNTENWED